MILLDTCAILWLVMEPESLSPGAKRTLAESRGYLFVSSVNAFEIAQKHAAGKLELPKAPHEWFEEARAAHGLQLVPLLPAHAFRAAALEFHHRDPFDRLLVGTAAVENLSILTPDRKIRQYSEVPGLW